MTNAIRAAALLVVLFAAHGLLADETPSIPWHSSPELAMKIARAQHKLLLVYFRGACRNCNDKWDETFAKAAGEEVFTHTFDTFLPLRVTAGTEEGSYRMLDSLANLGGAPHIAVYDSTGERLTIMDPKFSWTVVVEELLRLRGEKTRLLRAMELRRAGKEPEADLMLGSALLSARTLYEATNLLERAVKGFRATHAEALAQTAQILQGNAAYLRNEVIRGRELIEDVLRKPASDHVAAQAYLAIASINEAASLNPTPTRGGGRLKTRLDRDRAINAYRKAYELAPDGTKELE